MLSMIRYFVSWCKDADEHNSFDEFIDVNKRPKARLVL